jgi:hypothetical protein
VSSTWARSSRNYQSDLMVALGSLWHTFR